MVILPLLGAVIFLYTGHTGRKSDQESPPNPPPQQWSAVDKATWVQILPPTLTCLLSVP